LDPIVIVLTTAAGALIGTGTGIVLLRSKLRVPITDSELADLKGKLQAGEAGMAAANANLDDLRKQTAAQERALTEAAAELKKKQEQVERESKEAQREKDLRTTAEQQLQELGAKVLLLNEQTNVANERAAKITAMQGELDTAAKKVQEATEQTAKLAAESAEFRRVAEQEARLRSAMETQLVAEQSRNQQLTTRVAELEGERVQLEIRLQDERKSTAKGMELLLMAQEKLSAVFKAAGIETHNGNHVAPEAAKSDEPTEVAATK
jgi:chromosome segregation ATPase